MQNTETGLPLRVILSIRGSYAAHEIITSDRRKTLGGRYLGILRRGLRKGGLQADC